MSRRSIAKALAALLGCAALAAVLVLALGSGGARRPMAMPGLRISGRHVVDNAAGRLEIRGVNRSGTEYACVHGRGIFDGPSDDASIATMTSWGINTVRVPLNEDCWLGIGGLDPAVSGSGYQEAIRAYVGRLLAHRLDVILDLHWVAPGRQLALGLEPAPDADHAPAFWASVARQFKGVRGVAFDLFNEPHGISWACWLSGCQTPAGWRSAGMQELIDAIRSAGARQPVIAEGLQYGADLSGWLGHRPRDPLGQLVAGWHMYDTSVCNQLSCWNSAVAPVARQLPVIATEVGEGDCSGRFLDQLLPWADAHRVGYLAWTWNASGCSGGPALIRDYNGTPTPYGAAYLAHVDPTAAMARVRIRRARARSFDFRTGTEGWTVRWGTTLRLAGVRRSAAPPPHGLVLELTGQGYPAAGSTRALDTVGPGSVVTYRLSAPIGVAAALRPMLTALDFRVTLLTPRPLHPGLNTVSFRVPAGVPDVRVLGLQLDDPSGWSGRLVLDRADWTLGR